MVVTEESTLLTRGSKYQTIHVPHSEESAPTIGISDDVRAHEQSFVQKLFKPHRRLPLFLGFLTIAGLYVCGALYDKSNSVANEESDLVLPLFGGHHRHNPDNSNLQATIKDLQSKLIAAKNANKVDALPCGQGASELCPQYFAANTALKVVENKCPTGEHIESPPPSWWKYCKTQGSATQCTVEGCGQCKKPNLSQGSVTCGCAGLQDTLCDAGCFYPGHVTTTKGKCTLPPCTSVDAASEGDCETDDFGSYCADTGNGKCGTKSCPLGMDFNGVYGDVPSSYFSCHTKFNPVQCPGDGKCPSLADSNEAQGVPQELKDPKVPRKLNKICAYACLCGTSNGEQFGSPNCKIDLTGNHFSGQKETDEQSGSGPLECCWCDDTTNTIAWDKTKFDQCGQYLPIYGQSVAGGQSHCYENYASLNGLENMFPEPPPICVAD